MELKLVGVAETTLKELLIDYKDYLRQPGLVLRGKNDQRAVNICKLCSPVDRKYHIYLSYKEDENSEVAANSMVCIIN